MYAGRKAEIPNHFKHIFWTQYTKYRMCDISQLFVSSWCCCPPSAESFWSLSFVLSFIGPIYTLQKVIIGTIKESRIHHCFYSKYSLSLSLCSVLPYGRFPSSLTPSCKYSMEISCGLTKQQQQLWGYSNLYPANQISIKTHLWNQLPDSFHQPH